MNKMTIRLSNLTTEQLTTWLEMIQLYPDNVTHWDAKKQPRPILREVRSLDEEIFYTTEDDEEVEDEETVEEPVIENQDVVVRFNDPDESPEPQVSGWLDLFEDKVVYPDSEDTSATQPNDPSM